MPASTEKCKGKMLDSAACGFAFAWRHANAKPQAANEIQTIRPCLSSFPALMNRGPCRACGVTPGGLAMLMRTMTLAGILAVGSLWALATHVSAPLPKLPPPKPEAPRA